MSVSPKRLQTENAVQGNRGWGPPVISNGKAWITLVLYRTRALHTMAREEY